MKLEICPHCGNEFRAKEHRYSFGLAEAFTPRWPSTRLDQQFTVRCPACGNPFVSSTLKLLGLLGYSQVPWALAIFVLGMLVAAWLN